MTEDERGPDMQHVPSAGSAPDSSEDATTAPDAATASAGAAIDLGLLYRRQRPSMLRLARLLTGSFEIAEEVVQEAFVKLQHTPTVATSPEGYLRTIVTNLSRGYLRRLRLERGLRPQGRIVVPAPELDETWAAVCRLPFRQRAVLVLRYYEDLSEVEIARVLDCRVGTVKSAHHRALAALRRQLA